MEECCWKTPLTTALLPPCKMIPLGLEAGSSPSNYHKPVLTLSTSNRKEDGRPGLLHIKRLYHRPNFILSYMDVNNLIRCKQRN